MLGDMDIYLQFGLLLLLIGIIPVASGIARWLGASRILAFCVPVIPLAVWLAYGLLTNVAVASGDDGAEIWMFVAISLTFALPMCAISVCIISKRDDFCA